MKEWHTTHPAKRDSSSASISNPGFKIWGNLEELPTRAVTEVDFDSVGNLYALYSFSGLLKIGSDGQEKWFISDAYHHDLVISEDGKSILALKRKIITLNDYNGKNGKIDVVAIIDSSTGRVLREVDLFPLLKEFVPKREWRKLLARPTNPDLKEVIFDGAGDLTHCNSIELVRHQNLKFAKADDIIISCGRLGGVFIIDLRTPSLLWSRTEIPTRWQHDASVTNSGKILFLENHFIKEKKVRKSASRVVEIDPATKKISWEFYRLGWHSSGRGTVQELPNGNMQILYAKMPLAVEVTREKKVVWKSDLNFDPQQYDDSGRYLRRIKRVSDPKLLKLWQSQGNPRQLAKRGDN